MTGEIRSLTLGGHEAPVGVREHVHEPETSAVAAPVLEFADAMFDAYTKGTAWSKELFFGKGSSDIIQALRLFSQKVNFALSETKKSPLNTLELEEVVGKQCVSLTLPLQNLCRWTVLIRIGMRKMQRDLLGIISMVPLPGRGSVKLNQPTDNVGRTQYAVAHLFGERFLIRGYTLSCDKDGNWLLGGPDGNRWFKDMWLTPGLQTLEALTVAKKRKLSLASRTTKRERRIAARMCKTFTGKIESVRAAAGIDPSLFSVAHGARLDLENKIIMATALASARAIIAQATVYEEDAILDEIANRCGSTKAQLIDDASIAGSEEQSVLRHYDRRQAAYRVFRPVGSFQMPDGYMIFSEQGVPDQIPIEERTELAGVSGVAVSAAYLSTRYDVAALRRSPFSQMEVEDLSPLFETCGVTTLNGRVVENMRTITRDAEGNEAQAGREFMQYTLRDRPPAEMPLNEFLRKSSVRFLPMVINARRRRLNVEDLQGHRNGISWAVSFEDVSERFRPCPKKKSKRSST